MGGLRLSPLVSRAPTAASHPAKLQRTPTLSHRLHRDGRSGVVGMPRGFAYIVFVVQAEEEQFHR